MPELVGRVSAVYRIDFAGKFYIGSSVHVTSRWKCHLKQLKAGRHHSSHFQRSFDKNESAEIRFSILEIAAPDALEAAEQRYLDTLKPFKENGLNVCPTAYSCRGIVRSEETKRRLSAAKIGKRTMSDEAYALAGAKRRGRKQSPELVARRRAGLLRRIASTPGWGSHLIGRTNTPDQIERIAAKLRGRKLPERSAETRAKLSAAMRGKKKSTEQIEKMRAANLGRKHAPKSAETRAKLSAAHIGKKKSAEHIEKLRLSGIGRKVSAETREKIRLSSLGRTLSSEWRAAISAGHSRKRERVAANSGVAT